MNRLREIAAAAALALAAITAPPPLAALAQTTVSQLDVDVPEISWSRDSLSLSVSQHGTLEGRKLTVIVFVDNNMIRTFPVGGKVTPLEIDGLELEAGAHTLRVKSGTHEATDRFRYLPAIYPAAAAALIATVALVAAALRRRRRTLS